MGERRKKAEGIALLSMYNDADMDADDEEDDDISGNINSDHDGERTPGRDKPWTPISQEQLVPDPETSYGDPVSPMLQPPMSLQSTLSLPALDPFGILQTRRQLGVVDYAHDETAVSPDLEEGEFMWNACAMSSMEFISSSTLNIAPDLNEPEGQEKTPPDVVQPLTPATQVISPPTSMHPDLSKSEAFQSVDTEMGDDEINDGNKMETVGSLKVVDPLDKFLPSPPKTKCSWELQDKINKFLAYTRAGKSFNSDLRNRKDYRNPDFLRHAVTYQEIDEIGTCLSKDVFDPHGFDSSDYYDKIEVDMKRQMEKKEQERKENQKVEFVQGGVQPSVVLPASKASSQAPGAAISGAAKDGRQSKKSKWDKVDVNQPSSLHPGGQDKVATSGAHAALLSAANAGAGYTAFAQQKRKEAEEKRANELKSVKIS